MTSEEVYGRLIKCCLCILALWSTVGEEKQLVTPTWWEVVSMGLSQVIFEGVY